MSIQSRITRGIGFGALAVATLGFVSTVPPTPYVNENYNASGATGGSGGQPQQYDWRSVNDLFKTDKTAAQHRAILMADDEAAILAIITAVTEEMI